MVCLLVFRANHRPSQTKKPNQPKHAANSDFAACNFPYFSRASHRCTISESLPDDRNWITIGRGFRGDAFTSYSRVRLIWRVPAELRWKWQNRVNRPAAKLGLTHFSAVWVLSGTYTIEVALRVFDFGHFALNSTSKHLELIHHLQDLTLTVTFNSYSANYNVLLATVNVWHNPCDMRRPIGDSTWHHTYVHVVLNSTGTVSEISGKYSLNILIQLIAILDLLGGNSPRTVLKIQLLSKKLSQPL